MTGNWLDVLSGWSLLALLWVGLPILTLFLCLYATRKWTKYQFSRAIMWAAGAMALSLYQTWSKVLVAGLSDYDWPLWIDIQTPIINALVLWAIVNQLYALIKDITSGDRNAVENQVIREALSLLTLIKGEDYPRDAVAVRRLGGDYGVRLAVWNLYDRIMRDPLLARYFVGADMDRVRSKQLQMFLTLLGVADYRGPDLFAIHNSFQITDEAFDRMIELVGETLADTPMDAGLQAELVDSLRQFKPHIVAD